MKKSDLLKTMDKALLDKLFGFCYTRTASSHEAEDLCSDIVLALVKAARTEGDLTAAVPFIWQVAHNTYADYAEKRKIERTRRCVGDPQEVLRNLPDTRQTHDADEDAEQLARIYREIAFLTRAYREVMIAYYLDGQSVSQIAVAQHASETAIRQRLFSARDTIRKEVTRVEKKPIALQSLEYVMWGNGNPKTGDPREVCHRQLSKHVVWLCRDKAISAKEISEQLHVPMPYVEEELAIQAKGKGGYGLLKKLDNGKYITNSLLLDQAEVDAVQQLYLDRIPWICDRVAEYVEQHREDYLAFPYRNKRVDLNLVLWQQLSPMAGVFGQLVENRLQQTYFTDVSRIERPFTVFGYRYAGGKKWGGGWDGVDAQHVCGYENVHLENIYIGRIQAHFHCGLNVATDPLIQLALRAIDGLPVDELNDAEKEQAARAIRCGYLFREGAVLYTKILTMDWEDRDNVFELTRGLREVFRPEAERVADELAEWIRHVVPARLIGDYVYVNTLAGMPMVDLLAESLIERGWLTPPENGIGAEGCWMSVKK